MYIYDLLLMVFACLYHIVPFTLLSDVCMLFIADKDYMLIVIQNPSE